MALPDTVVSLPPDFLPALITEIDHPDFAGILLGGSYARGDATRWSDVDIACIVPTDALLQPKSSFYRDGRLVTIAVKSIEGIRANLRNPDLAIVVVPGIGDCRVLLDKDGSVTALLNEVRAFTWDSLREAADARASFRFMLAAEMALKVANELTKGDPRTLPFPIDKLFAELTIITAISRGVLSKTDRTYYQQVQEAAGPAWTRHHQAISGADVTLSLSMQAESILYLYRETASLLRPSLLPDHLAVIDETVHMLEAAGFLDSQDSLSSSQ
jgi:hypothetical protein